MYVENCQLTRIAITRPNASFLAVNLSQKIDVNMAGGCGDRSYQGPKMYTFG